VLLEYGVVIAVSHLDVAQKIPNLAEKPILTEVQAVNSKMITGTKANVCIQLIKPFKHFNWTVGVVS